MDFLSECLVVEFRENVLSVVLALGRVFFYGNDLMGRLLNVNVFAAFLFVF